jgi:thiol-disulfide isomerase/thioredoxin
MFLNLPAQGNDEPTHVGDLMDKVIPLLVNKDYEKGDYSSLKDKDYILFYWSASWCGPCRRFTPILLDFYKEYNGGDRFEVILVGADKTEENMKAYMTHHKMPWYGINHSERPQAGMKQFAGGGIPHLMLIDKEGNILGRGRGQAYKVLGKFKAMLDAEAKSSDKAPEAPSS